MSDKRTIACRAIFFAISAVGAANVSSAAPQTPSLDGITVVKIEDGGTSSILGGSGTHLSIFVSEKGTYLSIFGGSNHSRCVAWAVPGSFTGRSIRFGLHSDSYATRISSPSICQPFTVTMIDDKSVQITAENHPLDDNGLPNRSVPARKYEKTWSIVSHAPLIPFDWGMDIFNKYDIKGLRLGPIQRATQKLGPDAALKPMSKATVRQGGTYKNVEVRFAASAGNRYGRSIRGIVSLAETLGWPWDALIEAQYTEQFEPPIAREAFEQALLERYGNPSIGDLADESSKDNVAYWLFGLDGIQQTGASAQPCTQYFAQLRAPNINLEATPNDYGPWTCALAMKVQFNSRAKNDPVRSYTVQVFSGYVYGLNFYVNKLSEVRKLKEKVESVRTQKPKL